MQLLHMYFSLFSSSQAIVYVVLYFEVQNMKSISVLPLHIQLFDHVIFVARSMALLCQVLRLLCIESNDCKEEFVGSMLLVMMLFHFSLTSGCCSHCSSSSLSTPTGFVYVLSVYFEVADTTVF